MKIGIISTRQGYTDRQAAMLRVILSFLPRTATIIHGDCYGYDEDAHKFARINGLPIEIYPPIDERKRAFCKQHDDGSIEHEAMEYAFRTSEIVKHSDFCIVIPHGPIHDKCDIASPLQLLKETSGAYITILDGGKPQMEGTSMIFAMLTILRNVYERIDDLEDKQKIMSDPQE